VLPDGCHADRNPSVHATILSTLIDIRALYKAARIAMPEVLQHTIDRMTTGAAAFPPRRWRAGPVNGSQQGEPLSSITLLTQADARAAAQARTARRFERMSLGRTVIIVR